MSDLFAVGHGASVCRVGGSQGFVLFQNGDKQVQFTHHVGIEMQSMCL